MRSTSTRSAAVALAVLAGAALARGDGDLSTVPRIRLEDFKKELEGGRLLVIDVRAPEAYRLGHIPGAFSVPFSAWNEGLPRLKASRKPIVAYCA